MKSKESSLPKEHGVCSGRYDLTSSLSISPTQVERIFPHCRDAVSSLAASLLSLQPPSLEAGPLSKRSKLSPPSFSLFHWDQMALGKYCMIWTCQIAVLIRAFVTLEEQSLGKQSSLMRLAPDSVGDGNSEGRVRMHAEKIESRKKILLITGKSETSLLAGLEQEGCDVTVCESPQKAWGFVHPIRPDVIILHLQHLSSKDIYALQECLALADGVPVIIATGASRIEAFRKKLGRVVPRFLSLPLKPNTVREALHGLESEWRKQF